MRIAGWPAILTLLLVQSLPAQAPRARPSADSDDVRMELASVLLQSKRYLEAATEYRAILAARPHHFAARLGLARALAWSNLHRAAEAELLMLRAQQPRHREVAVLLRSVRGSLEPSAGEATGWLRDDPDHVPYRRALARALMREGRAREAVGNYARLVAHDLSASLVVEAAHAYLQTREYDACAALLERALARGPDAALLLTRAQLHLARRDLAAAEADALASVRILSTANAYLLLGDVRRWRAEYDEARTIYGYARRLSPASPDVHAATAHLARAERPIPAFIPAILHLEGWRLRSTTAGDNAGVIFSTAAAGRTVALRHGMTASLEVELRRLQEESASLDARVHGAALTAGLAHEFTRGAWLTQLQARGGLVHHEELPMLTGALSAAWWYGPWALSLEVAHRPSYPALLTAAAIVAADEAPIRETVISAAFGGPAGRADIAITAHRAVMTDANQRQVLQLVARHPVARHIAFLGTASGVWYREGSELYWSPQAHLDGAAGLELSDTPPLGFGIAVRALAGSAWSAGLGLGYRSLRRDVGMAVNYGAARDGDYRRFDVSLSASLLR